MMRIMLEKKNDIGVYKSTINNSAFCKKIVRKKGRDMLKTLLSERGWRGRKLYYSLGIGGVLVCLLLVIVLSNRFKPNVIKEEVPIVSTKIVGSQERQQSYNYSGEVCGRYESQLSFQVNGKIIKRNVELGSVVKAGDILMQIDAKDIQQAANVSEARMNSTQSELTLAKENLERYRRLCEQGAVSKADFDRYQNSYNTAVAAVRGNAAQYAQDVNKLEYSNLYAGSEGIITDINVEAGQVVNAGQKVITLVKDGEREVEINVPENRLDEIRKAKEIKVSFWALPNVVIDGKVREIAPMAERVSRTYKVRISLINPTDELKLGMTSTVMVKINGRQQMSILVPLSALYQTGEVPGVWAVRGGVANLISVKIGVLSDTQVEVLEGLKEGELIVTNGVHKLREGQKVRIAGDDL